jgi:hypothetical protein
LVGLFSLLVLVLNLGRKVEPDIAGGMCWIVYIKVWLVAYLASVTESIRIRFAMF